MSRRQKTHCIRGHEMSGENVYVPPGHRTVRQCRRCRELSERQRGLRRMTDPEARERRRLGNARYQERHRDEIRLRRQEPARKAKQAGYNTDRIRRMKSDPELRQRRALVNKQYREKRREREAQEAAEKRERRVTALRQIVDHYYDDESKDYDAQGIPPGHIFEALAEADEWLQELTATP